MTTEPRSPAGPFVILLVDDEPGITGTPSIVFEKEGYAVRTAGNCADGLKLVEETAPDLVLCDMMMPDGNGLDLLREIKARRTRDPVVMMTAYTSTKTADRGDEAGRLRLRRRSRSTSTSSRSSSQKALERKQLADENIYLRRELERALHASATSSDELAPMQHVFALIERVARTDLHRADHGRERHRQGADRAGHPLREPARARGASCRSTAAPCPRTCSRASCSATSAAPSPARCATRRGCSRRPTAARSSSTRSAR